MKNRQLAEMNFHELLQYEGQPPARNSYEPPLRCSGYCVSCEESSLLHGTGMRLDQMSHACDTADFEQILGPMPRGAPTIEQPILFLLENPGGDYENGAVVEYKGFRKRPPVNTYYWTPNVDKWPSSIGEFSGNFYGPYFAYLMRKHGLRNVYITNVVKCDWRSENSAVVEAWDSASVVRHCIDRYLKRELRIFAPRLAFCFGRTAERELRSCSAEAGFRGPIIYLAHPSAIRNRAQAFGKTIEEMVDENDQRVADAIAQIA